MDNQNMGQQIPPVEPKAQSASPLNKGLIIGLSVGIVILLAAVIYLLTAKQAVSPIVGNNQLKGNQELAEDNNQSPTADWKTYQGSGFEFKYPQSVSVSSFNEAGYEVPATGNEDIVAVKSNGQTFLLIRKVGLQDLSEESIRQQFSATPYNDFVFAQVKMFNKEGIKLTFKGSGEEAENKTWYYFEHDGVFFQILIVSSYSSIANQILSTFKFTSQNETAEWKSYSLSGTNTTLQFGYPADMTLKEKNQRKFLDGSNFSLVSFENNQLFMSAFVNDPGRGLAGDITVNKQIRVAGVPASYQGLVISADMVPNPAERKKGVFVQFAKGADEYGILFWYPSAGPDQTELIDKILLTFKFSN